MQARAGWARERRSLAGRLLHGGASTGSSVTRSSSSCPMLVARAAASGPVALLFGPEDNGLDQAALDRGLGGVAVRITREWAKKDLLRRDDVRVTSATRTIIDLAGHGATARELERAIDSAVRLRLSSVPTLTKRMRELAKPGRRGLPMLRALLLDSGGESVLERRFLRVIRESGLPRPLTQVTFKARSARAIRVDFLYPDHRLVVEVSGKIGHASDADRRKDARRRNDLQQRGFVVLEFTTADVMTDPAGVVATVQRSLGALVGPNRH